MNSYNKVMADFASWTTLGWTKAQRVVALAEDTLGWPYVWGASGEPCTPAKRTYYASRSVCPDGEKAEMNRLEPGICDYYRCGDYLLQLYSNEEGTLISVVLSD